MSDSSDSEQSQNSENSSTVNSNQSEAKSIENKRSAPETPQRLMKQAATNDEKKFVEMIMKQQLKIMQDKMKEETKQNTEERLTENSV